MSAFVNRLKKISGELPLAVIDDIPFLLSKRRKKDDNQLPVSKIAGLENVIPFLDDVAILSYKLFGNKKKEEKTLQIQPTVRGINIPMTVPLNKVGTAGLVYYGTKPRQKYLKSGNFDATRASKYLKTDKQLAKLSELLAPAKVFRQSKDEVVPLPKPKGATLFKADVTKAAMQLATMFNTPIVVRSKYAPPIIGSPVKKTSAANYEWQGQEMIEAKSYMEGGGTQHDPSSVQKLQAMRQLEIQAMRKPPNIVEALRQFVSSKKNNDQHWDFNGNRIK